MSEPTKPLSKSAADSLSTAETEALDETHINPNVATPTNTSNLDTLLASQAIPEGVLKNNQDYGEQHILKERFLLTKLLGSGGMGSVYLARDLLREEMGDSASLVAIKILNDSCKSLPGALQALQREAKKAQQLSHPNIVTVYDFDKDRDTAYLSMEFIDGTELFDLLAESGPVPASLAQSYIQQMLSGLGYAHKKGFAHADVKPANIFISSKNEVKVLDFGIAKAINASQNERTDIAEQLTDGALTPSYASLQALEGSSPSTSDDVYSAACVAYEMLTGKHPFADNAGKAIPANIAKQQGLTPARIKGVSKLLMNGILKGLSFDDKVRFKDANAFLDAIKPRSRKKDILLGSAAAIVIALGVALVIEQYEPPVTLASINKELTGVIDSIVDADAFMELGDTDSAHRLYAHAWELTMDESITSGKDRDLAQAVIAQRIDTIIDGLIRRSESEEASEFEIKGIYIALKFLSQDQIPGKEKALERALKRISKQYPNN